jgi:hypothetical protein
MPDLEAALDQVTEHLAETMFFSTVLDRAGDLAGEAGYAAAIRFSGSRSGAVRVVLPQSTAELLAADFLGEPDERQAGALVGELANILCGSLLGRMDPAGRFSISPPEITAVAGAFEQPADVRRVFTLEEGPLAVEVTWSGQ